MRALVIDDSKPVRGILAKMLRVHGFEVVEAVNGREGLERIKENGKPDLATVNWRMPEMDGIEFIQAIRADPRLRDLPLVMISGQSEPAEVATAMAAGADEYIVKPCTTKALIEKLTRLGIADGKPRSIRRSTVAPQWPGRRGKIRVLVVDDSTVVRQVISSLLARDPQLEVAAVAAHGQEALDQLPHLRVDVILLDIEMPVLDGLQTLRAIRKTHPHLPVIMFSSLTERGAAVTTDALLLGANDYVAKPGGTQMRDPEAGMRAIQDELIPKIKQLSLARTGWSLAPSQTLAKAKPDSVVRSSSPIVQVVTIGLSTGGPNALARVLQDVPRCCSGPILPVPLLIVQHMPPVFTKHLADRLRDATQLDVAEAIDGELLGPGQVRIAPGGFHMIVTPSPAQKGPRIGLTQQPPVNACRPSVDVLFQSAADVYGGGVLAVVMTGMGNDGLMGSKSVIQAGGQVLAQDQSSSVVWGMPGHVARAGLATAILPLEELAPEIMTRIQCGR